MKSKKTMLRADGFAKITRISESSIQVRVETDDFPAPLRLNGPKNRTIGWQPAGEVHYRSVPVTAVCPHSASVRGEVVREPTKPLWP